MNCFMTTTPRKATRKTFCTQINLKYDSTRANHIYINVFIWIYSWRSNNQGTQVIDKVWSEIRGGATQRGGVTHTGGATQRGGVTQIFTAPKLLLAVQFYLLFIIDQHK